MRTQLHENRNWVLIYDNMQSFDIMKVFFPNDPIQWGNGKVIITTRNQHVAETSYIKPEDIIHIDELSEHEMVLLFSKILYDAAPDKLDMVQISKIVEFLKNIPPFPLDVSVAAYSIKNTHVTFEQYLKHIREHSAGYDALQSSLLKEVTDYSKTRYGIISSTLEKLSTMDTTFKKLFFFICEIDSQDIPYELLEVYESPEAVEKFVYHLRQNGLLLREAYADFAKENKVISIHRSTQEIGAAFMISTTDSNTQERWMTQMLITISKVYDDYTTTHQVSRVMMLVPHLNALVNSITHLKVNDVLLHQYATDIYTIMGDIYYKWLKNFVQAKHYFQTVLRQNKIYQTKIEPHKLAILLRNLCAINVVTNYPEEGIKYCNESVAICHTLEDSNMLVAENLQSIGAAYRKTNNFEKARDYLTKALNTLSNTEDVKTKDLKAEIYSQLGLLYLTNYLHLKPANVAKNYYGQMLELAGGSTLYYNESKPLPANIVCNVGRYRWKYSQFFVYHNYDYDMGYKWLQEAQYVVDTKCPQDMFSKGRILCTLGEVLLRQNNVVESAKILTESINLIGLVLGTESTWFENVLRAEARIRSGKFQESYEDSMHVLNLPGIEKNNLHDLRHWTAYYHAAVAQYKLDNYNKALEHFKDFIIHMDSFCKNFLDAKQYNVLVEEGAFIVQIQNQNSEKQNIQTYLDQSLKIFTAIYGVDHSFVKDYINANKLDASL